MRWRRPHWHLGQSPGENRECLPNSSRFSLFLDDLFSMRASLCVSCVLAAGRTALCARQPLRWGREAPGPLPPQIAH